MNSIFFRLGGQEILILVLVGGLLVGLGVALYRALSGREDSSD